MHFLQSQATVELAEEILNQASRVSPLNAIGYSLAVLILVMLCISLIFMLHKERKYSKDLVSGLAEATQNLVAVVGEISNLVVEQRSSSNEITELKTQQCVLVEKINNLSIIVQKLAS